MEERDFYKAPPAAIVRLRGDWLARRVEENIRLHALLPLGARILVAVSGGRDSMVLLRILAGLGYWDLTAAHCNFHLRGTASNGDEAFTRAECGALGVDLHVARFDTLAWCKEHNVGTEEGARQLRYEWFAELCEAYGYSRLAVAHHADDQAETMLLNAARGAGLRGLRGMPRQNGIIVRPLLETTRHDIDRWISEQQMPYREDATNAGEAYARNVIRHNAITAMVRVNRRAVEHMSQASDALSEAREALLEESERLWGEVDAPLAEKGETVATDDPTAREHGKLLRFWLRERMGYLGFSPQQASDALRWLNRGDVGKYIRHGNVEVRTERQGLWLGSTVDTNNGEEWYKSAEHKGSLTIHEEACGPFPDAAALRRYAARGKAIAVLDADRLQYPFVVRPWRAGDRIRPLGMRGSKLVSDVLTDERVASHMREQVRVVECGEKIAWVVGFRVSGHFALSLTSTRAVVLDAGRLLHNSQKWGVDGASK